MSDELTTRLRRWDAPGRHLMAEAADHIAKVEAERDELQRLCGMHDPTGADHMEDAARLADENDELRAENERLRRALREVLEALRWLALLDPEDGER